MRTNIEVRSSLQSPSRSLVYGTLWERSERWGKKLDPLMHFTTPKSLPVSRSSTCPFIFDSNIRIYLTRGPICIDVENAFHALALDEHRATFFPTVWFLPSVIEQHFKTNLKQCWFPGVHSDIGGGYDPEKDYVTPHDFSDIALAWMIDQCDGLLTFNHISEIPEFLQSDKAFTEGRSVWAAQPINNSMTEVFRLGGVRYRTPGENTLKDVRTQQIVPMGDTKESIHPSVRVRLLKARDPKFKIEWQPVALNGFRLVETSGSKETSGWKWVKTVKGPDGKDNDVEIPEYQIKPDSLEAKLLALEDHDLLQNVKLSRGLQEVCAQGSWFHDHIW